MTSKTSRIETAKALAEAGCTPHEIMSVTGHKTLAAVERWVEWVRGHGGPVEEAGTADKARAQYDLGWAKRRVAVATDAVALARAELAEAKEAEAIARAALQEIEAPKAMPEHE